MKNLNPRSISQFLRQNWFPTSLIAMFFLAFIRQDVSLNFQVSPKSSPMAMEAPLEKPTFHQMGIGSFSTILSSAAMKAPVSRAKPVAKPVPAKFEGSFVERFAGVAKDEQNKFGIPASIILASGILLSEMGTSAIVAEAQNFFMLPCTQKWDGDSMEIDGACFRWYGSAWESFRDHSLFLAKNATPKNNSLTSWANAIEDLGWTDLKSKHILYVVNKYDLDKFDK
ncbi:MAG: hypothetical protein HKN16_06375 [Saprospiraceae bacterium]|nr:hypothetical protein [Saprospiraceae bacterium]